MKMVALLSLTVYQSFLVVQIPKMNIRVADFANRIEPDAQCVPHLEGVFKIYLI